MGVFRGVTLDDLEFPGDRVHLRRWRAEDAAEVHAIMADRSMYDFLRLPDPYTPEAALGFVTQFGDEGREPGTGVGSAVIERDTGRVVGSATIRLPDPTSGEIGYWIAPAARGLGYGAEATGLLRDWAFAVGVERLEIRCDTRNLASVRVALAAAFRFEGIARGPLPEPGEPMNSSTHRDLATFGLLADDPREEIRPAFPPVPDGMLDDGELGLRPARPEDAAGLFEVEDDVAARWDFFDRRFTFAQVRRTATDARLNWLVGNTARFAMIDLATGELAGQISLRAVGPPLTGGIGYGVHPRFRGRGFTARALRLITRWAFEDADYARLELGAKAANIASQRAAASGGFEPDGVRSMRLRNPDGTFSDEIRFALVNPRWR